MYPFDQKLRPEALSMLKQNGEVFTCLEPGFRQKLELYLPLFEETRKEEKNDAGINKELYPSLPFGIKVFEWTFRQQSLKILERLISNYSKADILEVGSWNGWLSNRLASQGHNLLATDYFLDEVNGLQAKKFYQNNWTALQMDVSEPGIFKDWVFDIVIVNHALQFMPDPELYIKRIRQLIKPGGMIVLLGLSFYKNPDLKILQVSDYRKFHEEKHGFAINIHPSKSYLDFKDLAMLQKEGFRIKWYPGMLVRNLASIIFRSKPRYCYGILRNDQ
jgi:2-polyprenyl-3-methyl-5-hydroxy-6-metoxy-1,4-benzoquinol methylase